MRFTSARIRTTVVSHGVRDRTARRSACTFVQHEECGHDGVQPYRYTESTVPVRDRTTSYRGVRGRTTRASGRTRSAAGRHTWYASRVYPTVYEIVEHNGVHAGTSSSYELQYTSANRNYL